MTVLAAGSAVDAPGTLSFLVIFGMAVVLFFLFRSMSKHLRKVNEAAREEESPAATGARAEEDPVTSPSRNGQPGL